MTKLEYYLILIAAQITGDLLTSYLRRVRKWWKMRKIIKTFGLNKDNVDLFFCEMDKVFKKCHEEEFRKKKGIYEA